MLYSFFLTKRNIVVALFMITMLFASAAVFVKAKGSIFNVMDKLATKLEYTSELEVNGSPGVVYVYTMYDFNAIERLAKHVGYDPANISEDGFRVKLDEKQGGGMLFAISSNKLGEGSAPLVLYFSGVEKGTPQWLFPELPAPEPTAIQFSVKDTSRKMTMCTYIDNGTPAQAIDGVRLALLTDGWDCVTPGTQSTGVFFAKEDSVVLVSATSTSNGSTVLIMKKK